MKSGLKHLIKCKCILPQFKRMNNPPLHQFVVFSIIEDDEVKQKYCQCPNCGIIHRINEINKSEILPSKEHMNSITRIDDVKLFLNEKISSILETNDVDIATWEQVQFIIENEDWGSYVTLSKDTNGEEIQIKLLKILSSSMFKIETEIRKEYA